MLGILQQAEIETVLRTQFVGRLGYHENDRTYIVPISYVYDGQYIYCHSQDGKKTTIMRNNPCVCFQVEQMRDMANWKTVMAHGRYEEIYEQGERNLAIHKLLNRKLPYIHSSTAVIGEEWPFYDEGYVDVSGIIFRIVVADMTGRFEAAY